MAKPRHLVLATDDPDATAELYKQAFGLREARPVDGELARDHFLTDGTITIAVLKFKSDQLGKGLDYTGLHHIGFVVEVLDQSSEKLEALGAPCFMPKPEPTSAVQAR